MTCHSGPVIILLTIPSALHPKILSFEILFREMVTRCYTNLYSDFPPTKHLYESLFAPSEYDATTQELLEVMFGTFSSLISRLVEDHLLCGKFDNPSTLICANHSERDFVQLDRFCVRNQMQALYHYKQ